MRTKTEACSPGSSRNAKQDCPPKTTPNLLQAKTAKQKHKLQDAPKITASCALLGNQYGVGIGLYFQILAWLRLLLFWLAICMVGTPAWKCRSRHTDWLARRGM